MTSARNNRPCPYCGEEISVNAEKCRYCGRWLPEEDDDDDRLRRRLRRDDTPEATDFLVPTNVSVWAMASCYLGLFSLCVPFVGVVFALPALIFGIIALKKQRRRSSYGSVTGNIRAVIGVVASSLAILGYAALLAFILLSK
jgi:hypothetical protein